LGAFQPHTFSNFPLIRGLNLCRLPSEPLSHYLPDSGDTKTHAPLLHNNPFVGPSFENPWIHIIVERVYFSHWPPDKFVGYSGFGVELLYALSVTFQYVYVENQNAQQYYSDEIHP